MLKFTIKDINKTKASNDNKKDQNNRNEFYSEYLLSNFDIFNTLGLSFLVFSSGSLTFYV